MLGTSDATKAAEVRAQFGFNEREDLQMSRWTIFLKSSGCDMGYFMIVFRLFSSVKSNFC